MIDLKQNTLTREIPSNLLKDEKVQRFAQAMERHLKERTDWIYKINYTVDLEQVEDAILDHLLWEKHITWDEGLSLIATREQKISMIKAANDLHRTKGTAFAIEQVLSTLGLAGEVIEWFKYDGDPYHFKVEVEGYEITFNSLNLLKRLIDKYKNVRSTLEFVSIRLPQTQYIELESSQFNYPVHLPICGTFYCDGIPGKQQAETMEIRSENYNYPVHLPITGEIYANEVMDEW